MISFLLKRLSQVIIVMLAISLIAFAVQSKLGDPVAEMVSISASAQEKAAVREELGLNAPFLVQYGHFITNVLHGDFGTSYFYKRPKGLPLAFSSRFPITEVEELDEGVNRGFLLLKSGGIYFIVVHMTSQKLSARRTESAYISKTIKKLLNEKNDLT